jgi:endonuclease/exonuclease/phosphatase (EEP) superfamily protein YafD
MTAAARWRRALGVAAALCAAGLLLGMAEPIWPGAAAPAALRAHLCALALALAGALWATRARKTALAMAVLALGAAGTLCAPAPPPAAATARPAAIITLATANLRRDNTRPDAMARDLLALGADILAVQEIPPGFLDAHPEIRRAYPYGAVHFSSIPPGGRGVLSRLPLAAGAVAPRAGDQPGHAAATFDLGRGARLRVMSVHFAWPLIGPQAFQIDRFARFAPDFAPDLIRPEGGPAIAVAGDFNAARWSDAVTRVGAITRAAPVGGLRGTYRGITPESLARPLSALPFGLPIDHILLSADATLLALTTAPIAGSDHLAVRAVISVPAALP